MFYCYSIQNKILMFECLFFLGSVWKGTWKGKAIALKQLGNEQMEELAKEGERMMELNHPNVVKFFGIYKGLDKSFN